MTTDERYMLRCIELAQGGMKNAQPNPMVGAVVVYDDRIIGEGYHVKCGEGHAEVNALASVKDEDVPLLGRSTIYVSLEPCAHYGKTPPCAELIIKKGLKRVVVGCVDPFAKVQGKGIAMIKEAGIEVTVGVLEKECIELNKRFMTFHGKQRPKVTLKWAQSSDGYIGSAEGEPRAIISNNLTTIICHKRRAEHQAIMVGRQTALLDNPSLNVREWTGNNPIRIVIDRNNTLPRTLQLFDGQTSTLVFTDNKNAVKSNTPNTEFIGIDFKENAIEQIMKILHMRGVQTLLVEGGRELLQSFIDQECWDEAYVETAPCIIGKGTAAPILKNAGKTAVKKYSTHKISEYHHKIV